MNNKISFFKKAIFAIKDFEKYTDFAASSFKETIFYFIKLVAIFTIFLVVISLYEMYKNVNEIYNSLDENIISLAYENGNLDVITNNNEPIIIKNTILDNIIIDTTEEKEKQEEYINDMQKTSSGGIVFLKDKLAMKLANSNSMVITYSYSELSQNYNIDKFNKEDLLNQISGNNMINIYILMFGVSYFYLYLISFINFMIYVILIGILGHFTSIVLRLRIRYIAVCKMVVYSLTLPILLNIIYLIVNTFTGFTINYFDIIYIAISYIYIIAAILIIKSDVIKKGQELQEIIKEQERIREELRQKEEEEKQKKEEEKRKEEQKKKEKEKEKKEKKEKEKLDGSEPQGDNA